MMKNKTVAIVVVAIAVIVVCAFVFLNRKTEVEKVQEADTAVNKAVEMIEEPNSFAFSGTVLDGMTNQPLAAKITVKDKEQVVKKADCNASGEYTLSLGEGTYQISAEFPGYVAKGKNDVSHSIEIDGDSNEPQKITLWPEAQVKGRIVSDDRGIGSADLKFYYRYDDSGVENYIFNTVSSDESGNFLLKQAYGGLQDIEITAEGYALQKLTDITLKPGETVDLGDIPMRAGVTVFGIVTDAETSKAIPGATLQYLDNRGSVLMETKSQEDGSYKLPAIDMKNIQMVVSAGGYKTIHSVISSGNQLQYEYNPAMSKLAGISLVVNNQTGREPIKTLVTVTDIASEKVVYEHEYDNGFYRLDDLREGPYLVRGVSADKLTEVTARALAGDTTTLTLKPFAQLNVQFVVKKDGKPAKGTYRYIYKPADGEESAGSWTPIPEDTAHIDNLKPGTYWIESRPESPWESRLEDDIPDMEPLFIPGEEHIYRSEAIALEMGETRYIKQVMSVGGTLYGRIILPPHLIGKKIEGDITRISYYTDENGRKSRSKSSSNVIIDENGLFNIESLPEGEFSITLTSEDGYVSSYSGIKVDFDTAQSMDFDMSHSRKEADDGTSLTPPPNPTMNDDFMKLSDEERKRQFVEYRKAMKKYEEALGEQDNYQRGAGQNGADEAEINSMDE